MHIKNGIEYELEWIMELQESEQVAKFIEGSTIIESRINRSINYFESSSIIGIDYYFTGNKGKVPKDAMVEMKWDSPSFMIEKDGKQYVVTINPIVIGWQLYAVKWKNY